MDVTVRAAVTNAEIRVQPAERITIIHPCGKVFLIVQTQFGIQIQAVRAVRSEQIHPSIVRIQ